MSDIPDKPSPAATAELHPALVAMFRAQRRTPFAFQLEAWQAYRQGHSGLINAPTGVGKTLAAWLGPVEEALRALLVPPSSRRSHSAAPPSAAPLPSPRARAKARDAAEPLRVLWITPLRALAADTSQALLDPIQHLHLNWTIETRTGDTPQSLKRRQRDRLPTALITTPESLTLLLSYPDAQVKFAFLRCVIVDEWHELLATKRGVQTELALARLRSWLPHLRTWGLSATLANLDQACDVLLGPQHPPAKSALIRSALSKDIRISCVIPADIERFPWAGHLGVRSVDAVLKAIDRAHTTLLFTNTRAQAEIWFKRLLEASEDLAGQLAIHHGSLDRALRSKVESLLALGKLKCVVCTSSLDLGVDFAPVDQVIQIGSPKGVGRLLQRAGRSGHQPGAVSRLLGVPTHAFELIEFAAVRDAAALARIEPRTPLERPLDVLVQHIVTVACGQGALGFDAPALLQEVRSTFAFRHLSDLDWAWAMDFVSRGGQALSAYPNFARIIQRNGLWFIPSERMARAHRLTIGTITGETSMKVRYLSGATLGTIEESFIARLAVGDRFVFSGRALELLRVRDMTAFVRRAKGTSGAVPSWDGGRFSLSTQLADAVRARIDQARLGIFDGPELNAIKPLLDLQAQWSRLPEPDELLIELITTDRVHNAFLFLFAGRMVHEGLGALIAYRLARARPMTLTAVCTDYGICLSASRPLDLDEPAWREALSPQDLLDDLTACLNSSQMAQRQFRDIARVAGLVVPGYPGSKQPMRHLQASSEMFYDVFEEFDPGNLLITQAKREVLEAQLEVRRMREVLERVQTHRVSIVSTPAVTPFAFPIWAERLRANTLSTEKWSEMVATMVVALEAREPAVRKPPKTARWSARTPKEQAPRGRDRLAR